MKFIPCRVSAFRGQKTFRDRNASYFEALPGVFGNRGNRAFISGEQGNKGQLLRKTGEQRQYWGTEKYKKTIFRFLGNRGTSQFISGEQGNRYPPWEGLYFENAYLRPIDNKLSQAHCIKSDERIHYANALAFVTRRLIG